MVSSEFVTSKGLPVTISFGRYLSTSTGSLNSRFLASLIIDLMFNELDCDWFSLALSVELTSEFEDSVPFAEFWRDNQLHLEHQSSLWTSHLHPLDHLCLQQQKEKLKVFSSLGSMKESSSSPSSLRCTDPDGSAIDFSRRLASMSFPAGRFGLIRVLPLYSSRFQNTFSPHNLVVKMIFRCEVFWYPTFYWCQTRNDSGAPNDGLLINSVLRKCDIFSEIPLAFTFLNPKILGSPFQRKIA